MRYALAERALSRERERLASMGRGAEGDIAAIPEPVKHTFWETERRLLGLVLELFGEHAAVEEDGAGDRSLG